MSNIFIGCDTNDVRKVKKIIKKGNDPNGSVDNPDKIVSFSEIK